jgi:signal transduction histidine kinase
MLKNAGIAGHLRAGFLGITAFVLLAAGAGIYAFVDISRVLTQITEDRVPSTLAAQQLSRRAEAIIDSAPKLLASQERGQFHARARAILSDVDRLENLMRRIEDSSLDVNAAPFRSIVYDLDENLRALKDVVSRDIALSNQLDERLVGWDKTYQALLNLLEPSLDVRRRRLDGLRAGLVQFQEDSEARRAANADLRRVMGDYLPLQDLRVALAKVNDRLIATVESQAPSAVQSASRRLDRALADSTEFYGTLDTDTRILVSGRFENLRAAITSEDSLVALHAEKTDLKQRARTLLAKNEELSQRLNEAVNTVVAETREQIDASARTAERTKITGASVILIAVLLSVASAVLIMRYYVGRNVVRRLGAVRDSMLALSRGELDHPLPQPGTDEIGRMTYALSVFRDNAMRLRHRTRELQLARDEAVKSSEAKTRFLANMSHELRTPLNAVIGFAEIIQNEAVGPIGEPRYRDYAKDIHDSAAHLLEVINDILDVAKAEAGKLDLDEDLVDLSPFTLKTVRLLDTRAGEGDVSMEAAIDDATPFLIADPRRLRQILLNLLSNAIKFTKPGGTVRVEVSPREDGGLDLSVADTGVGMSDNEVEMALAPFSQIDNSFSRHAEGTGLGLPLTKHLVELHGGEFRLTSEKNVGTRITASFPASRVQQRGRGQSELARTTAS